MILDHQTDLPANLSKQAEEAIYQMAEAMGILVSEEEAAILDKFAEAAGPLAEQQNIVRLNKQAKLSSLTMRSALVIAQQRKDPLFAKYAKAAELKRRFRGLIAKKYGTQATSTARKLLANAGKRNLVQPPVRGSTFANPESRG